MIKRRQIILLVVFVISVIAVIIFLFKKTNTTLVESPSEEVKKFIDSREDVGVLLFSDSGKNEYYLNSDYEMEIPSTDLMPYFYVKTDNSYKLVLFSLDGQYVDLSGEDSLVSVSRENGYLKISPQYMLDPSRHILDIKIRNIAGNLVDYTYRFIVKYEDDFTDVNLTKRFWIKPSEANFSYADDLKWLIEKGRIIGVSTSHEKFATKNVSLMFLRRLGGDIDLRFTVKITSQRPSLLVYFMESNISFIVGNGSNKNISYALGEKQGDNTLFNLEVGKTYECHAVKKGDIFSFEINAVDDKSKAKSIEVATEKSLDLETVGFSLWNSSDGIEINNVSIWGEK